MLLSIWCFKPSDNIVLGALLSFSINAVLSVSQVLHPHFWHIILIYYKYTKSFNSIQIYTIDIWLPPEVLNLCLYFLVSVTSPPCTVSIVVLNSNPPALDVLNISGSILLSVVEPAGNIVGSLEGEPSLVPLNLKKVGLTPDKDKP